MVWDAMHAQGDIPGLPLSGIIGPLLLGAAGTELVAQQQAAAPALKATPKKPNSPPPPPPSITAGAGCPVAFVLSQRSHLYVLSGMAVHPHGSCCRAHDITVRSSTSPEVVLFVQAGMKCSANTVFACF